MSQQLCLFSKDILDGPPRFLVHYGHTRTCMFHTKEAIEVSLQGEFGAVTQAVDSNPHYDFAYVSLSHRGKLIARVKELAQFSR